MCGREKNSHCNTKNITLNWKIEKTIFSYIKTLATEKKRKKSLEINAKVRSASLKKIKLSASDFVKINEKQNILVKYDKFK